MVRRADEPCGDRTTEEVEEEVVPHEEGEVFGDRPRQLRRFRDVPPVDEKLEGEMPEDPGDRKLGPRQPQPLLVPRRGRRPGKDVVDPALDRGGEVGET